MQVCSIYNFRMIWSRFGRIGLKLGPFEFLEASDRTIVRQYGVLGEIASFPFASF